MSNKIPFSTRVEPQIIANTFLIVQELTGVTPDSRSDIMRSALLILERAAGSRVDLFEDRAEALRFLAREGLNLPNKAFENIPEENELQQSLDLEDVDLDEKERSVAEEAFLQRHEEAKSGGSLEKELDEIFSQDEDEDYG